VEAGLVDALEDRDGMSGDFADEFLEGKPGPEEEFERPGNALLEEQWAGEARLLIGWPGNPTHLGHRRKAVVELRDITAGLGRIAP
jgi:hypothetical protein